MASDRQLQNKTAAAQSVTRRLRDPLNKPTHAFVEITTNCNLACIQCNRVYLDGYRDGSLKGDIAFDTVKRLEPVLPDIVHLTATGFGEPFVHPELQPILRYLQPFGIEVGMISNGMLLDAAAARAVLDVGLSWICFSIDSPDPTTFRRIRIKGELDQVVENIRRLSRLRDESGSDRPKIALEFVAMAKNFLQLPQMPALAKDLGCHKIVVQMLFHSDYKRYAKFYERNNLTNIERSTGMAAWQEFVAQMDEHGLELDSYLREDLEALFAAPPNEPAATTPAAARQTSAPTSAGSADCPEFVGCIDRPLPFSSSEGKFAAQGWIQGLHASPRAEFVLESETDRFSWPIPLCDPRPDVVRTLPEEYMAEESCGFSGEIDISDLPPACYSMYISVENSSDPRAKRIKESSVYINMHRDMCMYCTQPWSTIFVSWKGEVRPCCFSDHVLGDLKTQGIEEIWLGEEYQRLRQQVIDGVVNEHCVECVKSGYQINYIEPMD